MFWQFRPEVRGYCIALAFGNWLRSDLLDRCRPPKLIVAGPHCWEAIDNLRDDSAGLFTAILKGCARVIAIFFVGEEIAVMQLYRRAQRYGLTAFLCEERKRGL